jgi:hypothetical protein
MIDQKEIQSIYFSIDVLNVRRILKVKIKNKIKKPSTVDRESERAP